MTRGRAKVAMSDHPRPAGSVPRPTKIPLMKAVWIYVDTSKAVGEPISSRSSPTNTLPKDGFAENDPEGVAFAYEVIE